jgi:hypothetical protein
MNAFAATANQTTRTIVGDQNNECDVWFSVNPDTDEQVGDGPHTAVIQCSGMFCSSVNFNFVTDGFFTESVTLVGNSKVWTVAPAATMTGRPTAAVLDAGAVKRRQHFRFDTAPPATVASMAPADTAITSCTISTDFGREEMNVLGRRLPYHRYVTFPIEVTCEIELYVTDLANLAGANQLDAFPNQNNLNNETIKVIIESDDVGNIETTGAGAAFHTFDLGAKNKINSITWGGGDTGGANATLTLAYRNFNKLDYTYGGPNGATGLY